MSFRSITAAMLAAVCSLPCVAQGCANLRAKDVTGSIDYGPANKCAGIEFSYGGLQITSANNTCPAFALLKPDHQVSENHEGTRTEVTGAVNATLITFVCKRDWLLWIIPDGYQCVVDSVRVAYAMNLLTTKGC